LKSSTIQLDKFGGVVCDPFLQSTEADIYAAGDVATFPYWQTGQSVRIEHYVNAFDLGSIAAYNMLGKMIPYGNIPFFWTRFYNKALQYTGFAHAWDEVYIDGSLDELKFLAYYIKDDKVLAVAGM